MIISHVCYFKMKVMGIPCYTILKRPSKIIPVYHVKTMLYRAPETKTDERPEKKRTRSHFKVNRAKVG